MLTVNGATVMLRSRRIITITKPTLTGLLLVKTPPKMGIYQLILRIIVLMVAVLSFVDYGLFVEDESNHGKHYFQHNRML